MTIHNHSRLFAHLLPALFMVLVYFYALPADANNEGIVPANIAATSQSADSAEELRRFAAPQLRTRYYALLNQLRCPKCQNQNLADSDAPIAADLRDEMFRLLHENYSDEQIREYMVARYGSFVLYSPPATVYTAVLWLLPVALMIVCAVLVWRITRAGSRAEPPPGEFHASASEAHGELKND